MVTKDVRHQAVALFVWINLYKDSSVQISKCRRSFCQMNQRIPPSSFLSKSRIL